jgi:hypothetical protein
VNELLRCLAGSCRLAVDGRRRPSKAVEGHVPLTREAGDVVLLKATPGLTMAGFEPAKVAP